MLWLPDEESVNTAKDACSGHRPGPEAPPLSARCDVAVHAVVRRLLGLLNKSIFQPEGGRSGMIRGDFTCRKADAV